MQRLAKGLSRSVSLGKAAGSQRQQLPFLIHHVNGRINAMPASRLLTEHPVGLRNGHDGQQPGVHGSRRSWVRNLICHQR